MLRLIRNENVKIYRRVRTWIFVLLVVLAVVALALLTAKIQTPQSATSADWRQQLEQQDVELSKELQQPQVPDSVRNLVQAQLKENEYRLAHDIPPTLPAAWSFTNDASSLLILVTLFVAVVAADSLAGEFAAGTIKLLLIRPYSRTKILYAKYLSVLLYALGMVLLLAVSAWIVGGMVFGFGGLTVPYLAVDTDGNIHQLPMYAHVLATYGLKCINLVMIATISFVISAALRSSSLAIAISILLLFVGSTVVQVLSRYSWDKYILFANTDLSQYLNGTPLVPGMTPAFSITVLIVYFVVFHAVAWLIFTRRDVAGR